MELTGEGVGLRPHLKEEEEVETGENHLPEKAAQVFSPALTILPSSPTTPRDAEAFWEMESEKSPFMGSHGVDYNQHGYEYKYTEKRPSARCKYTSVSHLPTF